MVKVNNKIITAKDQKALANLFDGKPRTYPAGQILLFEGDVSQQLALIKRGYVKAYIINEDGSNRITFILTPGMVCPVFTLLALRKVPNRYYYEAMTEVEADTTPIEVAKVRLNDEKINILAELSYIGQSLLADTVDVLSSPRAEYKIRNLLYKLSNWLAHNGETKVKFQCKLTHQDIADMAALTRETATQVIQKLKDEKSIWYHKQYLVVDKTRILKK